MSISHKELVKEQTGYSPFETQVQRMIFDLVDPGTAVEISKRISGLIIGSFPMSLRHVSKCLLTANEVNDENPSK